MSGLCGLRGAVVLAALMLPACAGRGFSGAGGASAPEPPVVNLSGYSVAYKMGHADGCAQRRDERLYREQADYMMGWNDGRVVCKRR